MRLRKSLKLKVTLSLCLWASVNYRSSINHWPWFNNVNLYTNYPLTQRLRKYVEKVMAEYNVLKTRRVMPWKTEFMNEVYNHLALSLCESYRLPKYKVSPYDNNSMCHLLGVSPLKPTEHRQVVFGDRSTYAYEDSGESFEQAKAFKWVTN